MAEVIWTEPALDQLNAILEFIALDSPDAALAVGRRAFAATDRLALFPKMGRPIPEFPHKSHRQVWVKPCWLYYRTEKSRALVLHVRRAEKLFRVEELLKDEE
jgi:plasmid stabilization system protein ParE